MKRAFLRLGMLALALAGAALLVMHPGAAGAGDGDGDGDIDSAAVTFAPVPVSPSQGGHLTEGDPRSSVVYPEQRIDITYHHRAHVQGVGETCTDCHSSIPDSDSAKDFNIPDRDKCLQCHEEDVVPWSWSRDPKSSAISMPPAHLRFSHRIHLKAEGITCASCHAGVEDAVVAGVEHLPSMEQCVSCHVERGVPADCRTCHARGDAGTIRTSYPSGTLVPDDHGVHFLEQHGMRAQRDLGTCASCHAQEDCLACHDGAIPPSFHASNYLQLHPQDAMANNPACGSCHRLERFCRDCHFRSQVTLGNPLWAGITGSLHPADWMFPGTPDFHGNVGRKNLASCTGCHVKQDCIGCHAFYQGAPRIHPPGFAGSSRMRQLLEANRATCLECHGFGEPGDPITRP